MVGHDPSVLASLEAGLDGAIAATASVLPRALLGIAEAHKAGDSATAQTHLARLNKWCASSHFSNTWDSLQGLQLWHKYCSHHLKA